MSVCYRKTYNDTLTPKVKSELTGQNSQHFKTQLTIAEMLPLFTWMKALSQISLYSPEYTMIVTPTQHFGQKFLLGEASAQK